MRILFVSMFLSLVTFLYASVVVGSVESVKGSVKVKSEGSIKKSKVKAGQEVKSGDLISTSKGSSAVIKLVDKSVLVLDESSSVNFASAQDAEQTEGKVYYKITSRDAKNSLKIKTPFAIIGIKGTTFIIDASKDGSLTLKDGLVGVQSIKDEFELYRKEVLAQFKSYVDEQRSEFEKYKAMQKKAMPQMTKEFDLKAGNSISFSGKRVEESAWTKEDDAEFEHFEKLINSMK